MELQAAVKGRAIDHRRAAILLPTSERDGSYSIGMLSCDLRWHVARNPLRCPLSPARQAEAPLTVHLGQLRWRKTSE